MNLYSVAVPIALAQNWPNNVAMVEIVNTETDRPKLLELAYYSNNSSSVVLGLGRTASVGVVPKVTFAFQPEDPSAPAVTVKAVTDWGTPPGFSSTMFRRDSQQNVIGGSVVWLFRRGIVIPVSGSLALWVIQGNPIGAVHMVLEA